MFFVQVSHSVTVDEWKREEARLKSEKVAKMAQWQNKRREIETRLERCLSVIKWATNNQVSAAAAAAAAAAIVTTGFGFLSL